jgi:hypothetical protein
MDTSMDAPVVTTLNLSRKPPNFRSRRPSATIGAANFFRRSRNPPRGCTGS